MIKARVPALLVWIVASVALAGDLPFRSIQSFLAHSDINGIAGTLGDVDGDGDLDLVLLESTTEDGVFLHLNDGSGRFGGATTLDTTMSNPGEPPALVDLDRDGDLDLVVASWTERARFMNDGAGNFGPKIAFATGFYIDSDIVVADVNGDGAPDLFDSSENDDEITLHLNPGNGAFPTNGDTLVVGGLDGVTDLAAADFDRDGDLDLISVATGDFLVRYHELDATGALVGTTTLFTPGGPFPSWAVDAGDVDRDGDIDAVFINGATLYWIENVNGDASVWSESSIGSLGGISFDVTLYDMDDDGDLDAVTPRGNANIASWWENNGDASGWTERIITTAQNRPLAILPGDLDRDGDVDAVVGSNFDDTIAVYENRLIHRNARFGGETIVANEFSLGNVQEPHVVDLDRDGDDDVVAISQTAGLFWMENTGGSADRWTRRNVVASFGDCCQEAVIVADLDGDGDQDLAVEADGAAGTLRWYDSDGGAPPTFTERTIAGTLQTGGGVALEAGDIDNDGDIDLLHADFDRIAWHENLGGSPPSFTERILPDVVSTVRDLELADLDGDGDLDALSGSDAESQLVWYENDGGSPPSFTARPITAPGAVRELSDADVDGDGDLDIVVTYLFDVRWYENTGGTPIVWVEHFVGSSPSIIFSTLAEDLDADGDVDLLAGGFGFTQILFESNGARPPQWTERELNAFRTYYYDRIDLNGDGDVDLVASASNTARMTVMENIGGQYNAANANAPSASAAESAPASFLATTFTLNGRPGDPVGDLDTVELLFRTTGGVALTTVQAQALFDSVQIWRDEGSGLFEPMLDSLVFSGEPDLSAGVQTVTLPNDPNALVAAPATFFVVGGMTADAAAQSPNAFTVTHLTAQSELTIDGTSILLTPEPLGDFQSQTISTVINHLVDSTADATDLTPGDGLCDTGAGCTLRAAVQEALAGPGADVITLGAGTYTLTLGGIDDNAVAGDLDIGGSITVVGLSPAETTIDGGGIDRAMHVLAGGSLTLRDLAVTGGATVADGGAVRVESGASLTVERCDLRTNVATDGGAIFNLGDVTIRDSAIRFHTAFGAVTSSGGSLTITNSTLSGNDGRGVVVNAGTTTVDSSTLSANQIGLEQSAGTLNLRNSIVSGNNSESFGTITQTGPNLIGGAPELSPLGDHGGPTVTHALGATSPAIDAGSCGGVTTDQRGVARAVEIAGIVNFDDGCDLGAYEAQVGRTVGTLDVPVRWCAVRGAPSVEDPSLLGESTVNDVLRGRHEAATENIYRPQANILFRSAANEIVEDFPLLDDPDCVEGPPGVFSCDRGVAGDVFIQPESGIFDEFEELIAACRAAWHEQDPTITGVTAVHINRFIDDTGAVRQILGIGGRAREGDVTEQQSAGRVMVVDNLYRRDLPGNPDSPPTPEDTIERLLGHEFGHAVSLRHGNGLDDDGNGTVDDDDDATLGLPRFDGANLMQYRAGSKLTPLQVAQARAHIEATVPDVDVQPIGDSIPDDSEIDQKNASVLDFGFNAVLDLKNASVLDFKNASVLDFENEAIPDFKNASVLDFEIERLFDFKNASVLDFKNASVLDFGMSYRGASAGDKTALFGTTAALPWPAAVRPDTRYYFFLDVDRDDATGAYPRDKEIPGEAPRRFPGRNNFAVGPNVAIEAGIDLIAVVDLTSSCPGGFCSSSAITRVYDYNDGTGLYEEIAIPDTVPTITPIGVGLYIDNGGTPVEADSIPTAITIQPEIPNSVLFAAGWSFTDPGGGAAPIPDPVRMEVLTTIECAGDVLNDSGGDVRDCQCTDCGDCPDYPGCDTGGTPDTLAGTTILTDNKAGELTFEPPVLPDCVVFPQLVAEGGTVNVWTTELPTDVSGTLELTVDGTVLATAPTASLSAEGVIELNGTLPAGVSGDVVLSVGIREFAPRALCTVTTAPSLACPDNDGDGACDSVDVDDDNDGVDDGADSAPNNPRRCRDVDADSCNDCSSGSDDSANDGPDFDLDGLCDAGDPDDDNDGVPDATDGEPRNANACGDSDGDRCDDCVINATPTPADDGPDADADGICDFGDIDADNDGADDFTDCAPADPTLARAPGDPTLSFTSSVRVAWNRDFFGSSTTSDLLRGTLNELPVGSGAAESCLADGTSADFVDDATVPAPGEVRWYLVRSQNGCGVGGYGEDSAGTERISATCP